MKWFKYNFLPRVVFRIRMREHGATVVCSLEYVPTYFEGCDDVSSITLEMVFMTESQFDQIPEFSGF